MYPGHQPYLTDQRLGCQKRIGYTLLKLTPNLSWTFQVICKTRHFPMTAAKGLWIKMLKVTPTLSHPKIACRISASPHPHSGPTLEMLWRSGDILPAGGRLRQNPGKE